MKLTGPLLSMGASGSIGGIITMATWKGRPYARQLVTPSNPRSAGQTAFRAMFKFLSQSWATVNTYGAGNQSQWQDLAEAGNYSPFNAYVKYNQDLWSRFLTPVGSPLLDPGTPTIMTSPAATAGVKSIALTWTNEDDNGNWGALITRKTGSQPTGIQTEIIAVVRTDNDSPQTYMDLGLTTGTAYYYEIAAFDAGGAVSAWTAAVNATPT